MVAIVLGILKIIGILLLVILGLLLFAILSVLFVPVRYRAEGSVYEHLKGSASISWFLHLISLKVSYDGEARMDFRILWFHPGWGKNREDEREERGTELPEKTEPAPEQVPADTAEDTTEQVAIAEAERTEEHAPEQELAERVETVEVKPEQVKTERSEHAEVKPEQVKTERLEHADRCETRFRLSGLPERICKCIANGKAGIHRIFQRFKEIARKFRKCRTRCDTILAFIRDEENKNAFRLAKRQIFAIIRHVLPRKLEGKLHFGFDDPYTTGQVLTWISPFYGLYGRHVQVTPDFLAPCLDGKLKLKGRIRLGTLLFLVFRMLQNKQIRLWIRKWRES